jgi:hypothetical protein
MNNPYHISEILKFFDTDTGWKRFGSGMEAVRIRNTDKNPNSDPGLPIFFLPRLSTAPEKLWVVVCTHSCCISCGGRKLNPEVLLSLYTILGHPPRSRPNNENEQ